MKARIKMVEADKTTVDSDSILKQVDRMLTRLDAINARLDALPTKTWVYRVRIVGFVVIALAILATSLTAGLNASV